MCQKNADLNVIFFISRSDHRSGVVWLPAFHPHHHFTWRHLLSERAGKQPEIPEGDQWRGWRELLTQVQTPFSRICKPDILGKQWWHWALNLFKTFLMVSSTNSGPWFWNFCLGWVRTASSSGCYSQRNCLTTQLRGCFFLLVVKFSKIEGTRFWEMLFQLWFLCNLMEKS